jgi:hypothetical protein
MYIAILKKDYKEVHSFEWTVDGEFIIMGTVEDPNNWTIVEVEPVDTNLE